MQQQHNRVESDLSQLGTDSPSANSPDGGPNEVGWTDVVETVETAGIDTETATVQTASEQSQSEPTQQTTASTSTSKPDTERDGSTDEAKRENASGTGATQANDAESTDDDSATTETDDVVDPPLPLDQVFGILKNERRRRVLRMLQQTEDDTLSLSDLAEQIAAWENDKPIKQITSDERKRVYVGLYQCHLPKMDGMGVIDFNKPRGIIELGDNMDIMYRYLDTEDSPAEPEWHRYSMFLSVGGAAVLSLALLARPVTAMPVIDLAVGGLLIGFAVYGLFCFNWQRTHDTAE